MEQIPEDFLHYLWKYKLYDKNNLVTNEGEHIEIIENGWHNQHSGPDFFNARVKINDTLWAGNIEIHTSSSEWYNHKHHLDKAYDTVILQVVMNNNGKTRRTNGTLIPTLELKFNKNLYDNYSRLLKNENWIPCEKEIPYVDHFTVNFWLDKLTIERIRDKYEEITQCLNKNNNNWETTFYHKLARNFGFKVNADPFELLAQSLPIEYIAKHKSSKFQIEALLFGQAGFLNGKLCEEEYYHKLCEEYDFLKKKFNLIPMESHLWKFSKLRPSNFPTVRIAQFASILYESRRLFSKTLQSDDLQSLSELFDVETSEFWKDHYTFQKKSKTKRQKKLGKSAINIIIINTIIPFMFIYGDRKNKKSYKEKALNILSQLPPEKNSIIRNWEKLNICPENAYQSQALIQLKNVYCNHKKCLECQIGNKIINS
jgi:hypothetical protein